jgi:flagellar basal body P-ring protein FlgI
MPRKYFPALVWGMVFAVLCCALGTVINGCDKMDSPFSPPSTQPAPVLPSWTAGTIAQYASMDGGSPLMLHGYGFVVGLGKNGSSEVPARLRNYLTEYLAKRNVGSVSAGTDNLSISRFLQDPDKAIVQVDGFMPPGAPKGTVFDVWVSALPETQTRSLAGGTLLPADMFLTFNNITATSRVVAIARGAVFINPNIDTRTAKGEAELRGGSVIGGATMEINRPLTLRMRTPDYAACSAIMSRINEHFPSSKKIANATTSSVIDIVIPREHVADYDDFLSLLMHLPVQSGSMQQMNARAMDIAKAMTEKGAKRDDLALIWEAMGKQMIPTYRPLYTTSDPGTSFYATRTGLRLGDPSALEIMKKFAANGRFPLQEEAIAELGRQGALGPVAATLRPLLDSDNDNIRVAAYEALSKLDDSASITRTDIPQQFRVDMVESHKRYMIHASTSKEPRIVIFGKGLKLPEDLFYNAPEDLVTINANLGQKDVEIVRKVGAKGRLSDTIKCDYQVQSLVTTLGTLPRRDADGRIPGVGLTYSQVVGVLKALCDNHTIPARFDLQIEPWQDRMNASQGRPDMPTP